MTRPAKTPEQLQADFLGSIWADLQRYKSKLDELADGVQVEGKKGVYRRAPSLPAIVYLIDRILGKPTERHQLSGAQGEPLFPAASVAAILADPQTVALACELDRRLASVVDRSDSSGVRPRGEPGSVEMPAPPGSPQLQAV